jgi:alpha-tubulin suppressor-like RCC1 family protein
MKFIKSISAILLLAVLFSPNLPVVANHGPALASELWSFGTDTSGVTGLGTSTGKTLVPTQVGTSTDWNIFSAGTAHSLTVKDDGTLWSFGDNSVGATGLGTTIGSTLEPTQVGTDTDWASIAAGPTHSVAIKEDGTLWSFGSNASGATGQNASTGSTLEPTQVGGDSNWVTISAGGDYSLVIKQDGTLWSFGSNVNGRTGLGTSTGETLEPTQVGVDTNWSIVSAGIAHSLAVKDDGTLWSFGSNAQARTGLGTTTGNTLEPTQVGTDTDWASIAAGPAHSVAIKDDGTLWSFGSNVNGRTGLGLTVGSTVVPTQIGVDSDWVSVNAGGVHSLVLKEDETLWSFGANSSGATGMNTDLGNTIVPTQVGTDSDWIDISAGAGHSLVLKFTIVQPTISTVGSTDITQTSAELRGEMLTSGNVPKDGWGFNYGTTDSYGESIAGVTTLRNPGIFSLLLEGLECGTEYHFQAYVTTSGGDVLGDNATFTTTACEGEASSGGSSSGGSTSIVRQYEIYMERGDFEQAGNLKKRWPRFFPEEAATSTPSTASSTEAMVELVKKNIRVFEQAKSLGIVLPEFIETLLQQARETLLIRDLELHMEGDDVRALQRLLNQNGYAVATGSENGAPGFETAHFGERTQSALARYQAATGITPATGYFGAITRSYMKNAGLTGIWW